MKIVCLVKQVPRADAIEFDPETKSLRREGVPLLLNPFDAAAVVHAAALRAARRRRRGDRDHDGPATGRGRAAHLPRARRRPLHPPLGPRVRGCRHARERRARSRSRSQKVGDVDLVLCGRKTTRLRDLAGSAGDGRVPRLAAPHERHRDEARIGAGCARRARRRSATTRTSSTAPLCFRSRTRTKLASERDGTIDVWTATELVDDLRENDKRFGQTGSPTRVLAVRDVTPERKRIETDDPTEVAARVRELLVERALEPSQWEKPDRLGEKPGANYDAWTLVETRGRPTHQSVTRADRQGTRAGGKLGGANVALVLGHGVEAVASELGRRGAERVVLVDDERLDGYDPDFWSAALVHVLRTQRPHVLAIPATANGRDLGPRAAGELELGMTGDCVNLGIDRAGRLIQTKPAYGGNIVSVIMGATTPQLATVRPRMFTELEARDESPEIVRVELGELPASRVRLIEHRPAAAVDLDEEDLIVLLGPDAPADYAPRTAALAGTRERMDLPRNRQVGLYGRPVAPRVLVAIGVPGDFEQLTGIVKAAVIVAVNCGPGMEQGADVVSHGDPDAVIGALVREG